MRPERRVGGRILRHRNVDLFDSVCRLFAGAGRTMLEADYEPRSVALGIGWRF